MTQAVDHSCICLQPTKLQIINTTKKEQTHNEPKKDGQETP
jgi:hypothetical protein